MGRGWDMGLTDLADESFARITHDVARRRTLGGGGESKLCIGMGEGAQG